MSLATTELPIEPDELRAFALACQSELKMAEFSVQYRLPYCKAPLRSMKSMARPDTRPAGRSGKKGRPSRRRKLCGERGRGTLEKDKPPILGRSWRKISSSAAWRIGQTRVIQRGGQVILHTLPNVQRVTIKPIITDTVAPGSLIHTDEYDIYALLPAWGYGHKTVYHTQGKYARRGW